MGEPQQERLVDSAELAEILGISTKTLSKLIEGGSLPHYQVGRQHRFRLEEVLEALRAQPESVGA